MKHKRITPILLSVLIIVSTLSLPMCSYASECSNGEHFSWCYTDNEDGTHSGWCIYDNKSFAEEHHYVTIYTITNDCVGTGTIERCKDCGNIHVTSSGGHTSLDTLLATAVHNDDNTHTMTCPVCNSVITENCTGVYAKLHEGCEKEGYEKAFCPACNYEYWNDAIKAYKHSYDSQWDTATCTESGQLIERCSQCGNIRVIEETPPLGHSWEMTDSTEPTCTDDGSVSYVCRLCGDTKTETVPAYGHSLSINYTRRNDNGTHDIKCTRCNEWITKNCNYVVTDNKEATCSSAGYTTYTCSECGNNYTVTIEPKHDYVLSKSTDATCTEDGVNEYVCSHCGNTYQIINEKRHHNIDYDNVIQNNDGTHSYKCTECGELVNYNCVPDKAATVDATHTSKGYTEYHCSVCGSTYRIATSNNLTGHTYKAISVTLPTATESGYTTYQCSECGDIINADFTEPLGVNATSNTTVIYDTKLITPIISNVKVKGNKVSVKWKSNSNAVGYITQYSTSKKFAKKATITVDSKKKNKLKLKHKKKYYIRVRAYNDTSQTSWSNVKSVKTK